MIVKGTEDVFVWSDVILVLDRARSLLEAHVACHRFCRVMTHEATLIHLHIAVICTSDVRSAFTWLHSGQDL